MRLLGCREKVGSGERQLHAAADEQEGFCDE